MVHVSEWKCPETLYVITYFILSKSVFPCSIIYSISVLFSLVPVKMVVGESKRSNIMDGIENTGDVRLHDHRLRLKQR